MTLPTAPPWIQACISHAEDLDTDSLATPRRHQSAPRQEPQRPPRTQEESRWRQAQDEGDGLSAEQRSRQMCAAHLHCFPKEREKVVEEVRAQGSTPGAGTVAANAHRLHPRITLTQFAGGAGRAAISSPRQDSAKACMYFVRSRERARQASHKFQPRN